MDSEPMPIEWNPKDSCRQGGCRATIRVRATRWRGPEQMKEETDLSYASKVMICRAYGSKAPQLMNQN